ncbi:hypothetical protein KCTC52924_03683 [Arenibacter antarcticus]|uniref:PH domain-containing protein n=1 Tax=Arenibacter antarcticus TaxID=2040469 RepID=A0ABW5VI12_9FLAO|nr:hypothetical protein [Arenibacter sp. H213]MCM4168129.1 hypothetical protein [Arenibacter sp. H213]
MKIRYKKRHQNVSLIFGLIWLVLFFIFRFTKEEDNWTDYGWLVISCMYLSVYFYQLRYKYLTIEKGIIKVNYPLGKKISLMEIKGIKKFAGDYILKTDKRKLTIHTKIIDLKSLADLTSELNKLGVEWS